MFLQVCVTHSVQQGGGGVVTMWPIPACTGTVLYKQLHRCSVSVGEKTAER